MKAFITPCVDAKPHTEGSQESTVVDLEDYRIRSIIVVIQFRIGPCEDWAHR